MCQIPEYSQMQVVTMHMQGRAEETWVKECLERVSESLRRSLLYLVIDKFDQKSTMGLVGEFNKLKQWVKQQVK